MKATEIKNILFPTDFSRIGMMAMNHAVYMAGLLKANLHLLHVVEALGYTYSTYESDEVIADIEDTYAKATATLKKLASLIKKTNSIDVNTVIGSGQPATSIANTVKEHEIDLIIMGTHGASGFEEYFIGSNAHRVVNLAPCPVITVQGDAKKAEFKNIVMPIGDSVYSRQKVNYVCRLAALYGARVHILGLLNYDTGELDEKRFNIKLESVGEVMEKAGIPYICKVVKGLNIATEAMKYSEQVDADLIVIMTDYESTLNGGFLSSLFAKQIVNHSRVPVMSIKPAPEYNAMQSHLVRQANAYGHGN